MSDNSNPMVGGCPVKHDNKAAEGGNPMAGGCPVKHNNKAAEGSNPMAGGCPVKHNNKAAEGSNPMAGGCPVKHNKATNDAAVLGSEPPNTEERPIKHTSDMIGKVYHMPESKDPNDIVPAASIPATGRGNSEDGASWLNPSANQLYRALRRRDKPIEHEDALSVAAVHQMVTVETWKGIMEYERLHCNECPEPKLQSFQGMDGIYNPKPKILNFLGVNLPFDRHDWVVDRCGKEVKYTIDYYAHGEGEDIQYSIDARPAGVSGFVDRARVAFSKIFRGENPM